MIVPDNFETLAEPQPIPAASLPGFAQLPPLQQGRLVTMANDQELYTVTVALDRARNTVVAAVDGSAGNPEGDFLAAAYRMRGNLSAYDPVLQVNIVTMLLSARQVPLTAVTLTLGSVTNFGNHVPQTELLIPHPGPQWAADPSAQGLASCIESVLGGQSHAYVLTDNETPSNSQSAALTTNLQAVNNANAMTPNYTILTWTVNDPVVEQMTLEGSFLRFTILGGARLQIGHDPPHKLVIVNRQ
jgi:hypothetical protein